MRLSSLVAQTLHFPYSLIHARATHYFSVSPLRLDASVPPIQGLSLLRFRKLCCNSAQFHGTSAWIELRLLVILNLFSTVSHSVFIFMFEVLICSHSIALLFSCWDYLRPTFIFTSSWRSPWNLCLCGISETSAVCHCRNQTCLASVEATMSSARAAFNRSTRQSTSRADSISGTFVSFCDSLWRFYLLSWMCISFQDFGVVSLSSRSLSIPVEEGEARCELMSEHLDGQSERWAGWVGVCRC